MLKGTANKINPIYKSSLLTLHHASRITRGKIAINRNSLYAQTPKRMEKRSVPIRTVLSVSHDFTYSEFQLL